jgi:probable selenium-dependent hydroxylase accessory protein YqeC
MDLTDALRIRQGDVIAIVGGGGKTTALYRLGVELARRNIPVLLTGTTRFTPPEGGEPPHLTLVEGRSDIDGAIEAGDTPLTVATGWGSKGRLLPVEPAWIDALHRDYPDRTIVIEADGSAMRPFKAPNDREPVIPSGTTVVVCVVGMDAVGRPLDETHVHRPERVARLTGASIGAPVTPDTVARALMHSEGGQKSVPAAARWVALLNKADTPSRRLAADTVARLLLPKASEVIIGQVKRDPPVLTVVRY